VTTTCSGASISANRFGNPLSPYHFMGLVRMSRVVIDLIRWNKETGRTASYNAHITRDSQVIPSVGDTVIVLDQKRKRKIPPLRVERRNFYLDNDVTTYVQLLCTKDD
jgi:uncharacterized protein YhfF